LNSFDIKLILFCDTRWHNMHSIMLDGSDMASG